MMRVLSYPARPKLFQRPAASVPKEKTHLQERPLRGTWQRIQEKPSCSLERAALQSLRFYA